MRWLRERRPRRKRTKGAGMSQHGARNRIPCTSTVKYFDGRKKGLGCPDRCCFGSFLFLGSELRWRSCGRMRLLAQSAACCLHILSLHDLQSIDCAARSRAIRQSCIEDLRCHFTKLQAIVLLQLKHQSNNELIQIPLPQAHKLLRRKVLGALTWGTGSGLTEGEQKQHERTVAG